MSSMYFIINVLQDRIVFHRLEHICYCIETGEWPFGQKMPNPHILGIDSGSATPSSCRTPTLTPKGDEESSQALQEMKAKSKLEKDFEVQLSEVIFSVYIHVTLRFANTQKM